MTYPQYRIIVFGSRDWADYALVRDTLNAHTRYLGLPAAGVTIVHGACPCRVCWLCPCFDAARGEFPGPHSPVSADACGDRAARELGFASEAYRAEWLSFGRAAGPMRNRAMAERGADFALGFRSKGESRGTDGMADICREFKIPACLFDRRLVNGAGAWVNL
jgi:hypothetical protein